GRTAGRPRPLHGDSRAVAAGPGPRGVPRPVREVHGGAGRAPRRRLTVTLPDDDLPNDPLPPLLAAAQRDAAPPDRAFLERLREQSAAAFASSATVEPRSPSPPKGRAMITRLLAVAATLAAAIALFLAVMHQNAPKPQTPPKASDDSLALGKALDSLAAAKTVHLKVKSSGATREILAEKS